MRTFLASCLGLLMLAACSTPRGERPPITAAPHPQYKVGDSYEINGVWYYPSEDLTYNETGIASWYGEPFHGRYTANGDLFDPNALTAAHPTLPMPSIVEVTNLENGRSLNLEVNDRGPYVRGRIIDVSRRAAELLGFEGPGTAKVRVRILAAESIQAKLVALRASGQDQIVAAAAPMPVTTVSTALLAPPPGITAVRTAAALPAPHVNALAPEPPPDLRLPPLPAQATIRPVHPTSIYVQVGAFSRAENAERLQARLSTLGAVRVSGARVNGTALYRVRIGPVPTVDEADRLLDRIVARGMTEARIVVD
jgi:rare lipoprotein A